MTIDWGDGIRDELTSIPVGDRTFTAGHQYVDDDPSETAQDEYIVTVTLTDEESNTLVEMAPVTVKNVAPVIESFTTESVIREGEIANVSLSFSDQGRFDTHTAVISWGDGSKTRSPFLLAIVPLNFSTVISTIMAPWPTPSRSRSFDDDGRDCHGHHTSPSRQRCSLH